MIENNYDVVIGLYLGIILFFFGYWALGGNRESYMKANSLNYIFITFFIVLFFLFGYLFKNMFITMTDMKKNSIDVPSIQKLD